MSRVVFELDKKSLARARTKFSVRGLIAGPFVKFFHRVGLAVVEEAKPLTPVDTGRLRASITYKITSEAQLPRHVDIGTNAQYGPWVHDGRKPGSAMPPVSAIGAWAKRKGIDASPFVLARSIARKGIRGRPFLADGLALAGPKIDRAMDMLGSDIEKEFSS